MSRRRRVFTDTKTALTHEVQIAPNYEDDHDHIFELGQLGKRLIALSDRLLRKELDQVTITITPREEHEDDGREDAPGP